MHIQFDFEDKGLKALRPSKGACRGQESIRPSLQIKSRYLALQWVAFRCAEY
jgi:hypothetical protein